MKLYAQRDAEALGEFYVAHVSAMTAENLHSKSAIAAELAWRDATTAEKEARIKELEDAAEQRNHHTAERLREIRGLHDKLELTQSANAALTAEVERLKALGSNHPEMLEINAKLRAELEATKRQLAIERASAVDNTNELNHSKAEIARLSEALSNLIKAHKCHDYQDGGISDLLYEGFVRARAVLKKVGTTESRAAQLSDASLIDERVMAAVEPYKCALEKMVQRAKAMGWDRYDVDGYVGYKLNTEAYHEAIAMIAHPAPSVNAQTGGQSKEERNHE